MKIASITAGAAGMYCGSCLRDNTLAAALIEAGHDALLIPTYTPIRTDDENVSQPRIFFGGLNVYLQQKTGLFRHTPRWFDRLLDFLFRREGDIYIVLSNQGAVGKSGSSYSNDVSLQTLAHHLREAVQRRFKLDWLHTDIAKPAFLGTRVLKDLPLWGNRAHPPIFDSRTWMLLIVCGLIMAAWLLASVAAYLGDYLANRLAEEVVFELRTAIFGHVQRLSLTYHDDRRIGDLLARVTRDTDAIRDLFGSTWLNWTIASSACIR